MSICVESICVNGVTSSTPAICSHLLEALQEYWNVIDVKRFRRGGVRSEILGLYRYFGAVA
jgi:hypothetical protein